LALARLSAVSGLVPSFEWLLYSAVRKEALLTSQIEGTQASLTDLFDQEAGVELNNRDCRRSHEFHACISHGARQSAR
jgi:Fic family protein